MASTERQAPRGQAAGPSGHPRHPRVVRGRDSTPQGELHEAAEQLTANQAGLIAVGEPTIQQGLDKAFAKAAKVVKRTVEATTDELASELQEALKG
jgi:hypothetical protein